MTYTIPPGSPKAVKALAFSRELDKAMRTRDIGLKELARVTGHGRTAIDHYRTGSVLPKTATALALAEALDWPKLGQIAVAARTFVCARPGCGRTYRHEGGGPRRYCTPSCQLQRKVERVASTHLRRAGQTDDARTRSAAIKRLRSAARIADERAQRAEAAIEAMCRDCEPLGLCRTAGCPLRALSPLPLARQGIAEPRTHAEIRQDLGRRPEVIAKRSAAMRRRHAEPGFTERLTAASAAVRAAWTPEQHEAWRQSVRDGIAARTPADMSAASRKGHATRRAKEIA